ncbi:MAG: tRNA pseudouridine(38-40) synthase TruA [Anaerolineae bacterium]|jgi:tRNA pseudouridine38-40 synthase|nr:MAG: tRNA pseudouridine(38-40) synthase TruA [Anaerolineae bacterium]
MARYQVILAYDGSRFAGFQRQRRASQAPTVQGLLEEALRKLGWQGEKILYAGRTDRGVHAQGQVVAFDLEWKHAPQALQAALNAYLPNEVAVQAVKECLPTFHPRYQAIGRRYRYRLFCSETRQPLLERYAWRVWPVVEIEAMQNAAQLILGVHDFAAFGSPLSARGSTLRQVQSAAWRPWQEDGVMSAWQFDIQANAFLYHMVRRLVAAMVAIGQGRLTLEQFQGALQGETSVLKAELAPPQGLTLMEVLY